MVEVAPGEFLMALDAFCNRPTNEWHSICARTGGTRPTVCLWREMVMQQMLRFCGMTRLDASGWGDVLVAQGADQVS